MIRPATIRDLPALLALEAEAFTGDRISRRNFRHLLTKAHAISLVDEDEAGLCGYVTVLFKKATPLGRLYSIAVSPRCRGQRKGELLLGAAEHASRQRGCSALRLEVRPDNAAARGLYDRSGYRSIGVYKRFYEDGADAIRLEKQLSVEPTTGGPAERKQQR